MTAPAPTSPKPPLPPPNLRPARLDDFAQIRRLESSHGLLSLNERDWRGVWLDNPLRDRLGDDFPFAWVLEDAAGRVVGHLANIPTAYSFRGRELVAVTGRAWVSDPDYRGMALWLMDEYFNQPHADLFINTTVNALAVGTFVSFGSARVPVGDWENAAFRVTCYPGFARAALRLKNAPFPGLLSYPAGAALRARDLLRSESLPPGGTGHTIECADGFDARFDVFWESLVGNNPEKLLCRRDRRTLTWHFAGPMRAGGLWIFTASSRGLLRAYCVLKRQDHPSSGLIRMRLVDYQNLDPSQDPLPALLRAAVARCSAEKIHVLEHVGCGLPKMAAFDRYAPYRRKLPAWPYYFHAAQPSLAAALQNPAVWDPSAYDGDTSL